MKPADLDLHFFPKRKRNFEKVTCTVHFCYYHMTPNIFVPLVNLKLLSTTEHFENFSMLSVSYCCKGSARDLPGLKYFYLDFFY